MRKILLCLCLCFSSAFSQPIEFVVTSSPGGPDDTLQRKIAAKIEEESNIETVVLNKPGASKLIAYNYLLTTQKPAVTTSSDSILLHSVINTVEPLFYIGSTGVILMTNVNSPIKTLDDLIALSRVREIVVGHGGVTSQGYNAATDLCKVLSNRCLLVPYKSGPEAMLGLISNSIDIFPQASYANDSYINSGRWHPVVFLSRTKHVKFTDIATLPEKYKQLEQNNWTILFGKNLSEKNKTTIVNILKSLDVSFYTDLGYRHSFKDPKKVLQRDRSNND